MKTLLNLLLGTIMMTLVACHNAQEKSNSLLAVQLSLQGEQLRQQGAFQAAVEKQQAAFQSIDAKTDPGVVGIILNNLGLAYSGMGKYPEALEAFEGAINLHRKVNDPKALLEEGKTLDNMGIVYQKVGQPAKAIEQHQAALALFEKINSPTDTGIALTNIGAIYRQSGEYPKALATYQKALSIAQNTKDLRTQFSTLNNAGVVYGYLKQPSKALEVFQKSLEVAKADNNRLGEATALLNIAIQYKDNPEQRSKALDLSKQSLEIAQQLGARPEQGSALATIAQIHQLQNQTDLAVSNYRQAIAIFEAIRQELRRSNSEQALTYMQTVGGAYAQFADLLNQLEKTSEAQEVLNLLRQK